MKSLIDNESNIQLNVAVDIAWRDRFHERTNMELATCHVSVAPHSPMYASDNDDSLEVFQQLQSQVNEATTETIQADGRVLELERQMQDVQAEIEEKQRLLKEGDNAWATEKITFAVKVADLTNKLQGKEEDVKERREALQKANQERQAELEEELQELKATFVNVQKSLQEERKNAEGVREKLFKAEDNLEFEQMRFQKETKDLSERIQQEMSNLAKVENQFVEEQVRYKKERQKLEDRIKEESTRLLRAKSQLERDSKKFNEDQQELDEKLQDAIAKARRSRATA